MDVDSQSVATIVVAIVGLLSTLAAGAYAHRREIKSEGERWVRDRRADLYLAVTDAIHKGQLRAGDRRAIHSEIEALKVAQGKVLSTLKDLKSEFDASDQPKTDADRYETELSKLDRKIEDFRERGSALDRRLVEEDRRLVKNVEQIQDLFTPVQVFGSERVKALSSEIQGQLTALLAASVQPEDQGDSLLLLQWAELHAAMRVDLGVND